ncbi:MAG: AraC family transcriptional regulator [Pelatocladus maniniholoensis HA4357-MV3]|jgi:AraC family transcriptional regulator|uniref:AraC family transcriptional regulator n=1 Tax=Pelatocladus maniniholoensis HA4357-MV3 TaxID=1117104 RepID=A0A9E3H7I8_9NOST|nr:AraC family transcriptional regulator [Pelatocladus maniniholoensis HA4357-MV3]BAZ66464.1 transcriptional regulator [Fischerella sp. NIES-4106]
MQREKSLAIDVTRVDARKHVLTRSPILSSHESGWKNLGLEHHIQPAYESPEHYSKNYVLVIRLKCQLELQRWLGECHRSENCLPGDVAVIPPYVTHRAMTVEESEFMAVTLDSDFLANIAYESVDSDAVEMIPHFSKADPLIYQITLALKKALEYNNGLASALYADSMATALSAHLLQHYSAPKHSLQNYDGGLPRHKLQRVTEYIIDHLAEDLLLGAMAQEVGMSRYHFARLFKQSTGLSPYQYVIHCRIERAKMLLLQNKLKISEVASIVGFADQSQFTRHFKRILGVTPKEIRKK